MVDDLERFSQFLNPGRRQELYCPCGAVCQTFDDTLAAKFIEAHKTHEKK